MSQTPPSTTPTAPSETATGSITAIAPDSVTGTGVVPGIAYAPVVWKQGRPETLPHEPDVAEEGREAEAARLEGAVDAVATRLDERASLATGVASEVLAATATLARDRGWRKAALKLVKGGTPAPQAVIAAMAQFISTFARIVCILITCNVIAFLAQGSYSGISETSIPSDPTPQNPAIVSATGLASCRSITEAVNQSTVSTRIASHQPITADISASAETGRNPNRSPAASSATTSSVQMSDIRNSNTSNSGAARQCRARMVLPVADAHISKSFDRPSMR